MIKVNLLCHIPVKRRDKNENFVHGTGKVRYLNVLFFGFFILYAMMDIYYDGFYVMFTKNLVVFIQVFGIIEVILLCIWYPKEYRKKEAQKNGQVYMRDESRIYN